jgi:hypothetical protein
MSLIQEIRTLDSHPLPKRRQIKRLVAHNLLFTSIDNHPNRLQFNLDLPSDWLIINH